AGRTRGCRDAPLARPGFARAGPAHGRSLSELHRERRATARTATRRERQPQRPGHRRSAHVAQPLTSHECARGQLHRSSARDRSAGGERPRYGTRLDGHGPARGERKHRAPHAARPRPRLPRRRPPHHRHQARARLVTLTAPPDDGIPWITWAAGGAALLLLVGTAWLLLAGQRVPGARAEAISAVPSAPG